MVSILMASNVYFFWSRQPWWLRKKSKISLFRHSVPDRGPGWRPSRARSEAFCAIQ